MADLEPPAHTITIVASLKSLIAEKDVEDIYALLDANLNELEAAVDLVVTGNELLNLNSAKKLGLQSTSTTSETETQSDSSQLDVSSEPHPPASPSASPELRPWSYAKKATSNAAKAAVHKRQVKTRTSARLNKTAQPEPTPNRYEKRIDDRDDVLSLELWQLGKNLAATICALASDVEQIQKAQVSGLAEAMKRRSTDTWDLEPKDGWDVNKNTITVDSEDHIRIRTTNREQSFHSPGFEGLKDRITAREAGRKLACFISHPKRYIPFYAGVMKSPLWNLCPLHAGRLADIGGLRRANVPYAHCRGQYAGTAMHKEEANFGSASVGFAGITAFLFVDTRGTTMLEGWVRDTIPDAPPNEKSCDQWVLSDQPKQQIVSLMLGFRTAPSTISNETDLTDDNYMNVYPRYFDQVKKQTILTEFQVEYARSCLAKRTLEVLQEEGRDRVTTTNIDQVAQKLGLDVGTSLKMKDIYHVGRAWNKFCDDFD
ncbi:histone demethylation 3d [Fusarium globosum]|uniref:Histone demethylation 3d n=1 Tax=Fusarium globosum TaxID=78864 RepID=A0A8H5YYS6_9HYPO|nr:histone demethylation 3d [Fusarium globosum]